MIRRDRNCPKPSPTKVFFVQNCFELIIFPLSKHSKPKSNHQNVGNKKRRKKKLTNRLKNPIGRNSIKSCQRHPKCPKRRYPLMVFSLGSEMTQKLALKVKTSNEAMGLMSSQIHLEDYNHSPTRKYCNYKINKNKLFF